MLTVNNTLPDHCTSDKSRCGKRSWPWCNSCPHAGFTPEGFRLVQEQPLPPWPQNDREWARAHVGCNVSTCPNDRCNASGVCVGGTFVAGPSLPQHRTIIAFTGLAGAGKSTAALHLEQHHGFKRVRFAGPLKAMMAALGLTTEEIDGRLKEQPCALLGGKTPRWAMQSIGTEWGRKLIGDDLWVRAWRHAIDQLPPGVPVVVDDCRFPNEAEAVKVAGGVCVRVERPGAGTSSVHESEQHQLPAITTLRNDATPTELFEHVDVFVRDLSWVDLSTYCERLNK